MIALKNQEMVELMLKSVGLSFPRFAVGNKERKSKQNNLPLPDHENFFKSLGP